MEGNGGLSIEDLATALGTEVDQPPSGGFEDGDGDTRSVSTVVPHELESVEEDENQEADLEK
ncbi:hypothetical protein D9611_008437 [Ephemerocybe angulata]|uniref:Uncharacterized protein n=1 Tax=Ephemerocybe angulata TaxID=980116 RepID=A0A8H5F4Z5_9AGAR|nr:hypothetical protein D9611_008437 [Tulosesus angulatus]